MVHMKREIEIMKYSGHLTQRLRFQSASQPYFLFRRCINSFDNGLNISAGYEVGDLDNAAATVDETEAYFVGINGEVGPGELGAAMGTVGSMTEAAGVMPERLMYEVYYSYALNDGMTITPLIFSKEGAAATDEAPGFDETPRLTTGARIAREGIRCSSCRAPPDLESSRLTRNSSSSVARLALLRAVLIERHVANTSGETAFCVGDTSIILAKRHLSLFRSLEVCTEV